MKAKDEAGNRYGKLVVVSRHSENAGRYAAWVCLCDCGVEATVSGHDLRRGNTKSCGCLRGRPMSGLISSNGGDSFFGRLLKKYKHNAARRGIDFDLTDEQAVEIMTKDCIYCGSGPSAISQTNWGKPTTGVRNGIDRVDSKRGYNMLNVVPCCKACNRTKSTRDVDEFVSHCARIHSYLSETAQ